MAGPFRVAAGALSPLRTAVSFAQQPNTFALAITTALGIAMIGVSNGGCLARYSGSEY
jgi:hypothetical protein